MKINTVDNSPIFSGKYTLNNYKGCLCGGAIGDALGNPIEFIKISRIKSLFGNKGIQDLVLTKKGFAEITDDTQMTMFTADGIIKALRKTFDKTKMPDMKTVFDSYKLWLNTQNEMPHIQKGHGWIAEIKDLYALRAPGLTCISSLRENHYGTTDKPLNDSAGCGGVMRVAPIGLVYYENPELAFKAGCDCASLTHGNPRGYLAAGFFSGLIANIISGNDIRSSVDKTLQILKQKDCEPLEKLILQAKELSETNTEPLNAIQKLGNGWVGDEAAAISVYCALKNPDDFKKAVCMAVNHSGDSDSTGAITGNIMGAHLGINKIPSKWIKNTELTKELKQLAKDLYNPSEIQDIETKYPI